MNRLAMGLVGMFVLAAVGVGAAHAQAAADPKAAAAAAAASARADYLMLYDEVAKKIEDLGAAIPEDKYGYRPAEGVRTVGEVLNHIDGASYLFARVTGVAVPADAPKDSEKGPGATKKADILANLKKSLAFGRANAAAVTPEQLATTVDFFGSKMTVRAVYMAGYGHMSEHLGQLIAYARAVGVTPPWSK